MPDLTLAEVVYNEIINILFVTRVSRGQEIMEREEITSMLFPTQGVAAERERVVRQCLKELLRDKKIEQVGGRIDHYNYRLAAAEWTELEGQLKKLGGPKIPMGPPPLPDGACPHCRGTGALHALLPPDYDFHKAEHTVCAACKGTGKVQL